MGLAFYHKILNLFFCKKLSIEITYCKVEDHRSNGFVCTVQFNFFALSHESPKLV